MTYKRETTAQRELEPWEKKHLAERRELENYRGRRLRACRAADDLHQAA